MIHFSEHAEDIARNGFTRGSPILSDFAYVSGKDAKEPGYNFAMMADDEYGLLSLSGFDFGTGARSAVMFQASGVHTKHYDGFEQACFWGPAAGKDFVHLVAIVEVDEDGEEIEIDPDIDPHDQPVRRHDRDREPAAGDRIVSHKIGSQHRQKIANYAENGY